MSEDNNQGRNDEVYSKVVRAGKRTYFFDVKSTRNKDLYLTMTESKKTMRNGKPSFQKHKIFLYKEDFDKFSEGMREALDKIEELRNTEEYAISEKEETNVSDYSSVDFDDLG
tara:strand:+ start:122593 stop:122931 length:339 start_codon:yes stop_codon:yes gene_type:complete